jgi:hypothetical protein
METELRGPRAPVSAAVSLPVVGITSTNEASILLGEIDRLEAKLEKYREMGNATTIELLDRALQQKWEKLVDIGKPESA